MQYISDEMKAILGDRLKLGEHKRPNIRVEVDKYVYVPNRYSEIDRIRYLTDGISPVVKAGAQSTHLTSAGTIVSPIKGKIYEQLSISSPFGRRHLGGKSEYHHGIDIAETAGTPITAAADGEVIYAGVNGNAGYAVDILHAGMIRTRYFHMLPDSICVSVGEPVIQGQIIGKVGSTGRSTGPHLHFEVREKSSKNLLGESVDPVSYLEGIKHIYPVAAIPLDGTGTITGHDVNFRKGASIGHPVIRVLVNGTTGTVLAKAGEWYKMTIGADTGYVYEKYVQVRDRDTGQIFADKIYGIVTGTAVSIYPSPQITESGKIAVVNRGNSLECLGQANDWYEVRLADGREGYIDAGYFRIDSRPTVSDYVVEKVFSDDFEAAALYTLPSEAMYKQDVARRWTVQTDGSANVLCCEGGDMGAHTIRFNVKVLNAGTLALRYAARLSDGNKFNIYINNSLVGSITEYNDNRVYRHFSIPLLDGTHAVKLEREKSVDGYDEVLIDEINVYQYLYKESLEDKMADIVMGDTVVSDEAMIVAEQVRMMTQADENAPMLGEAFRGERYALIGETGEWFEIEVPDDQGQIRTGFVKKELAEKICGAVKETLLVKTGAFLYDRTLTLDNVVQLDIDYKYELRSAEATLTISNENGFYAPDYAPQNFPQRGLGKSPFTEYADGSPVGVLCENTPIRIYIGYGQHRVRRFTGLIDTVDIDGEGKTLTLKCSDMMKKLNNYYTYQDIHYPPLDAHGQTAWLTSSVIHDLAVKAGMSNWRQAADDLHYPDIMVEETYYTELKAKEGTYVKIEADGTVREEQIKSIPVDGGWRNPHAIDGNKTIPAGSCAADVLEDLCRHIGYWQRCDYYGTYRAAPVAYGGQAVALFRDEDNIVSIFKTIDYSRAKNHLIVQGAGQAEHFFDEELCRELKGERRTAAISVSWADDFGKKQMVARKMFEDIKRLSRTLQVCIEGNPYLEMFDTVAIESCDASAKGKYVIKGIRDTYGEGQGYLTFLDLCWEVAG